MLAQMYEILYFFPIDLSWIDFHIYLCGAAGYTRLEVLFLSGATTLPYTILSFRAKVVFCLVLNFNINIITSGCIVSRIGCLAARTIILDPNSG